MKTTIVTIVKDDIITGVEYGTKEITMTGNTFDTNLVNRYEQTKQQHVFNLRKENTKHK